MPGDWLGRTSPKLEMWANAQRDGRPANIGGALCSTPQSLADAHYYTPCSNAEITWGAPN